MACWLTFANAAKLSVVRKEPMQKRLAVCSAISIFVAVFATACSLFELTSSDDFIVEPGGFKVHLAMRVEWILTAPLMQLSLVLMGGEGIPEQRRFLMPGLSVLAMGLGIGGTLADIATARFGCYGFGCFILALLLYLHREQVLEYTDGSDGLLTGKSDFRIATLTLALTWCTFPIWYFISPEGLGVIENPLVIHAVWAFLNISTKAAFLIFMQRCKERERSEREKGLLREDPDVELKRRELNRALEEILSHIGVGGPVRLFDSLSITNKDDLKFPMQFIEALRRRVAPDSGAGRGSKVTIGAAVGLPGTIEAGGGEVDGVLKHVEAYVFRARDSEQCQAIRASSQEILAAIAGLGVADFADLEQRLSETHRQQHEELRQMLRQMSEQLEACGRQVGACSLEVGMSRHELRDGLRAVDHSSQQVLDGLEVCRRNVQECSQKVDHGLDACNYSSQQVIDGLDAFSKNVQECSEKVDHGLEACCRTVDDSRQQLRDGIEACSQKVHDYGQKVGDGVEACSRKVDDCSQRLRDGLEACRQKVDEQSRKADESSRKADESSRQLRETCEACSRKLDDVGQRLRDGLDKVDDSSKQLRDACSRKLDECSQKVCESSRQLRETCEGCSRKLDDCGQRLRDGLDKVDDSNKQLRDACSRKIDECSQKVCESSRQLRESCEACGRKVDDCSQKVDSCRREVATVQGGVDSCRREVATVQGGVDSCRHEVATVQGGVDAATAKLREIAGASSSAHQEAVAMRTSMDRLETNSTMLQRLQQQLAGIVESLASARGGGHPVDDVAARTISAMQADIASVRAEVREALGAAQGEMRASSGSLRSEMSTSIASVQSQMASLVENALRELGSSRGQQRDFDAVRERLDQITRSIERLAGRQTTALEMVQRMVQVGMGRRAGENNFGHAPPPVSTAA